MQMTVLNCSQPARRAGCKRRYRSPERQRQLRRRRFAFSVTLLAGIAFFVCALLFFGSQLVALLFPSTAADAGAYLPYTADGAYPFVGSSVDFNGNGIDDYTDFLLGARKDAQTFPTYDGTYCDTGYPADDVGVCTDVIWRAFRQAGYSLRDMVDADIRANLQHYPIADLDSNIDFRRVGNLRVFFDRFAQPLTLDIDAVDQWQAGDVVVFEDDRHIGIVSDLRNAAGRTFIIHNSGQPDREEDILGTRTVTGHYRFDAAQLPAQMLAAWHD